jgi:NADPH2 dehydrogenase
MANLLSNFTIKSYNIKNRVVFPPIVNFGWADNNGFVSEKHVKHYENIAKGGAGIIIVEATCVIKDGRIFSYQPGIWNSEHVEGFKRITDASHKHGSIVLIQ